MRTALACGCFVVLSCTAVSGAPCAAGNLQTFIDLGAAGCEVGNVSFTDFASFAGQTVGTPIDPVQVLVTPGGGLNAMLQFTLSQTAGAGEVFESFFRFTASDTLTSASIGLTPPSLTGDAAVTGILDVCPNGSFAGGGPFGCPTSPGSVIVFAIEQSSLLSDSATFAASNSLDVFVNLTIDGGRNGSATLNSATIGFSSVPEPSAGLLVALGMSVFGVVRARRRTLTRARSRS